ncbi:MAG TPA: cysteine dioxygenase family protein [Acidimicrobiales bacterium]|nr:cysteine dioxygenase family protein [Acidimicrobiales bacterium]
MNAVARLVAAVDAVLDGAPVDPDPAAQREMCARMRPAMAALLADPDPLPEGAEDDLDGAAVGNLLHADPGGRYHILAVVFPEGTSSGVHHHGCWGVIGYLRGGDEETRYRPVADAPGTELEEASRHVWHQGDITELLPPDDGWHRVRNPGPGPGVSVHILCMTPTAHPHMFFDRTSGSVLPFPFVEAAPGRWRAEIRG